MGACGNLWQILATFADFCQLFAFFSGRNVSGLNVFRTKRLLATDGGTAIHPKNEQIGGDLPFLDVWTVLLGDVITCVAYKSITVKLLIKGVRRNYLSMQYISSNETPNNIIKSLNSLIGEILFW